MEPVKVISLPFVAPRSQESNANTPFAEVELGVPTAENAPKVKPLAVGVGVGSKVPVLAVPDCTLLK